MFYLACRGIENGESAVKYVKEECNKQGIKPHVDFIRLDLSSFASIKEFSKTVHDRNLNLSLLINNAGVMFMPHALTEDGFESHYGVNYLGHYYLTMELMDLLVKTKSRILNLTSETYLWGKINVNEMKGENYHRWWSYCNSKLAILYFTQALHKKLQEKGITNVTVISVNPGSVSTNITRSSSGLIVYIYNTRILKAILGLRTPREGSASTVYSALSDESLSHSGGYIHYTCEFQKLRVTLDPKVEEELWNISESIYGKKFDDIIRH